MEVIHSHRLAVFREKTFQSLIQKSELCINFISVLTTILKVKL